MKMINNKGNVVEIQQTPDQKWFGFCEDTSEYTPAFVHKSILVMMLKDKGFMEVLDD